MTNTQQTDTLAAIFKAGTAAALAADPGKDADGGTCNFDSPALCLPRVREATVKAAAKIAGISAMKFDGWGAGWWWINVPLNGQGARRTKMAEAAHAAMGLALNADDSAPDGWHGSMYYQMD